MDVNIHKTHDLSKVPVNMTPGTQFALMNPRDPGRFLEEFNPIHGDLPVVFPSKSAALSFAEANKLTAQVVGTDDADYFMPGDYVYMATERQDV